MSDLISREAVMKEFSDFVRRANNSDFAKTPTWNDAVSLVGSMPSAQPERCEDCVNFSKARLLIPQSEMKVGKWVKAKKGGEWWCACSICSSHIPKTLWGQDWHSSYCPNCGARMEQ